MYLFLYLRVRYRAHQPICSGRWRQWIWEESTRIRSSFTRCRFWELLYLILCMWPGFEQKAQFPSYQPCQWHMVVFADGVWSRRRVTRAGQDMGQFSLNPWGSVNISPLHRLFFFPSWFQVKILSRFEVESEREWCLYCPSSFTPPPALNRHPWVVLMNGKPAACHVSDVAAETPVVKVTRACVTAHSHDL